MSSGGPPRILVVNDDDIGRYTISRSLQQAGFEVWEAATGSAGLELAESRPDLILLDVNLPDVDGIEVCRRLKANQQIRHIPVLHLSATFVDSESHVRGLESGADGYLTYPLEPPVLTATIRAHLRIREVEAQRQELAYMLEDVNDAIIVMDSQLRVQSWNRGAQKVYGWSVEEAVGELVSDLIPVDDSGPTIDTVLATLRSRGRWEGALAQTRRDGNLVHVLASLTLFDNGGVGGTRIVAVNRDVTDQRRAESERESLVEALTTLNEELEQRVTQRTTELTAANRALESRTDELEALAYSISHDLRAPLRGVDGFSQILLDDYSQHLGEEALDYLGRIKAGARLMGEQIDHLLQLSRLSRRDLRMQTVDLSQLAQEVVESLQEESARPDLDFQCEPGLQVYGDRELIRTLLQHLIHNAFKFTSGRASARIRFGSSESDGERVYYVEDNGIGFNMEYEGRLFTAFQQLHADKELTGAGIGLATVRRVVHRHGGTVWAKAQPDDGAAFYFTLPARSASRALDDGGE